MGRMIAGVCQGLANAYAWDVVWVRVITVLLTVFGGGSGLLAYIIFWIVMPEEPLMLPPMPVCLRCPTASDAAVSSAERGGTSSGERSAPELSRLP